MNLNYLKLLGRKPTSVNSFLAILSQTKPGGRPCGKTSNSAPRQSMLLLLTWVSKWPRPAWKVHVYVHVRRRDIFQFLASFTSQTILGQFSLFSLSNSLLKQVQLSGHSNCAACNVPVVDICWVVCASTLHFVKNWKNKNNFKYKNNNILLDIFLVNDTFLGNMWWEEVEKQKWIDSKGAQNEGDVI